MVKIGEFKRGLAPLPIKIFSPLLDKGKGEREG